MRFGLLLTASILIPSVAQAQTCDGYQGQTVELDSFEEVADKLRAIPHARGEYETTAEFEARIEQAKAELPERIVIQGILDPQHLTYDADKGSMRVSAYAIDNVNLGYDRIFGFGTAHYGAVEYDYSDNIDVVLSSKEVENGTYAASNAFGAKREVVRITRTQRAIFDRKSGSPNEPEFTGQRQGPGAIIDEVPMTVAQAKSLKETGKVAFMAAPKWPYFAEGKRRWEPTIRRPNDITEENQVIVADLQCALLMTERNDVIAVMPMN